MATPSPIGNNGPIITDATVAYYSTLARNMVPAIYDLFHQFSKVYNLNPYRAYLIGKFGTDDPAEVNKPENQIVLLKHIDDKTIAIDAADAMSGEAAEKNKEEYAFVKSILPLFSNAINDEAKHLDEPLTSMYLQANLVKPLKGESYLRVQIKCYNRKDWNKLVLDGKL